MTDKEKNRILVRALVEAGQYMRKYLPVEMPMDKDYIDIISSCLINGADDPTGRRFVDYFLNRAIQKIQEENKERDY